MLIRYLRYLRHFFTVQSSHTHAIGKGESKLLKPSEVMLSIRDLVVHLRRGNDTQAQSLLAGVTAYLNEQMRSGADPAGPEMQRAQQTIFAIDEVRLLLGQRDFVGATAAARDAEKEWRHNPVSSVAPG